MKKNYNLFTKKILFFSLLLAVFSGNAQHFTVTLDNFTSTSNSFEVDLVLIVDAPVQGVRLAGMGAGMMFNQDILNGGTPCTTTNCGSFVAIPGSRSSVLTTLGDCIAAYSPAVSNHIRCGLTPVPNVGVDLLPGAYVIDRFRFTNTVPWTANSNVQLWFNPFGTPLANNTSIVWHPYGAFGASSAYTTNLPAGGTGLTLGYTQAAPMSRILNPGLSVQENQLDALQVVPNPFTSTFGIDFETVSNDDVNVKVYDMIGKLIDSHTVGATAINTLKIGENYQSGIYNVSVAQAEKIQNIRVIKR